ncbi:hypothetical protein C9374_006890 [Naegleria lovaniensis]|uniref:Corrinoid adenosyltransferase MMAB n=1 Tax=Naegleria lovaniensis TaxID=51637 RepID=A0AA88GZB7_NAELO|nr:uncharacterized protein C9374_006890 [Naegleria lovaniensis]KAG2393359.1 hypothetical protein C9374_006890 [Naegleria lovaniensis]
MLKKSIFISDWYSYSHIVQAKTFPCLIHHHHHHFISSFKPLNHYSLKFTSNNFHTSLSTTRIMKIYTKTGDKGTTSLYSGERRGKDDIVFEALGSVDELNAHIGLSREHLQNLLSKQQQQQEFNINNNINDNTNNNNSTSTSEEFAILQSSTCFEKFPERLESIQSRLLDVGSCIATPMESTSSLDKLNRVKFNSENITLLEEWIDQMDELLPPLKNFILPSGGLTSSQLHVARTVCRRAERDVVNLVNLSQRQGLEDVQKYLNRLSDFLFMAARFAAKIEGKEEVIYKKE